MTSKKEYRSKTRIKIDILRVIKRERGKCGPTRILYGANLSHDRLVRYLNHLKELQLIEEMKENDKTFYTLTEKGREFLNELSRIERFAEAFGITL
jgi:predicted transcriptional regulator